MRAEGTSSTVGALDEVEPGSQVEVKATQRNRIKIGQGIVLESMNGLLCRSRSDQRSRLGRVDEALDRKSVV